MTSPTALGHLNSTTVAESLSNLVNNEDLCKKIGSNKFQEDVQGFVSSVIQSSLYRVYDGYFRLPEEAKTRHSALFADNDDPNSFEAYYLIDLALENFLKPSEIEDETQWRPRAKLEPEPSLVPNITWPTNEDFTSSLGAESIAQFIKSWDLSPDWTYNIEALPMTDEVYAINYRYRVRFSIPTQRTPVPRQTVSVYFTLSKSKVKPNKHEIAVFYVIESLGLVHRPGEHIFSEEWLKMVLRQKTQFGESIKY
ncbi:protein kinase A binding [Sparganum proliferum]